MSFTLERLGLVAKPESLVTKGVVLSTVSRYPAKSYGERIRRKRLELGLTQVGLANLLGVSEMSVVGWEKGWHEPTSRYLRKIQEVLGIRGL